MDLLRERKISQQETSKRLGVSTRQVRRLAKRFHERKKAKTNTVVAIKALAHKLARACFHILKEKKPFDVTRCFA